MTAAVEMACAWLLYLGFHPSLYYMADVALIVFLWLGVGLLWCVRIEMRNLPVSTATVPPRTWRWDRLLFLLPLLVTLLIVFRVPLRLGFLTALPGLTELVEAAEEGRSPLLTSDQRCGLYTISASANRTCHIPGRLIFILADDHESGFIYSRNGIDDLCCNEGNKGHLFGNWYWMKED